MSLTGLVSFYAVLVWAFFAWVFSSAAERRRGWEKFYLVVWVPGVVAATMTLVYVLILVLFRPGASLAAGGFTANATGMRVAAAVPALVVGFLLAAVIFRVCVAVNTTRQARAAERREHAQRLQVIRHRQAAVEAETGAALAAQRVIGESTERSSDAFREALLGRGGR